MRLVLHLFHPVFVHFAIAFIVSGAALEAYGWACAHEKAKRWGGPLLVVGTLTLIPVLFSGYVAANTISVPAEAMSTVDAHERNGWILVALVVLAQFWKAWAQGRFEGATRWLYVALLLAILGCTVYSALLGGELVYFWGVGVGE